MTATQPARRGSPRLAGYLVLVAAGIYAVLFAGMWLPFYAAGVEGQLFLYPLVALIELAVLVLAIAAVVLAIVGAVRGTTTSTQTVVVLVAAVLLLVPGPIVLWFGTVAW